MFILLINVIDNFTDKDKPLLFKYQVSLWETPLNVFFSVIQRYDKKFISKIEKYDIGIEFNYSILIYF